MGIMSRPLVMTYAERHFYTTMSILPSSCHKLFQDNDLTMAYDLDTHILLLDAALLGFHPQGHVGEIFLVMMVTYHSEAWYKLQTL